MNRFPVLTSIMPDEKKFMDRQKTVYLKATHKELPITLYWIEQSSIVGRKAFPCVYAEGDNVLSFLHTNKEASVPLETKWAELTPEIIARDYDVVSMKEKEFFDEYHNYRYEYIKTMPMDGDEEVPAEKKAEEKEPEKETAEEKILENAESNKSDIE